jgi:hypothetical protein
MFIHTATLPPGVLRLHLNFVRNSWYGCFYLKVNINIDKKGSAIIVIIIKQQVRVCISNLVSANSINSS